MDQIDYLIVTIGKPGLFNIAPELHGRGYSVAVISGSNVPDNADHLQKYNIDYWQINDIINKYQDKFRYDEDIAEEIKEK